MREIDDGEYFYTKNGEITYNENTNLFTVWDECYANVVCTTSYPFIAKAALEQYCAWLHEQWA